MDIDSSGARPGFGPSFSADPGLWPPIRTLPIRVEPVVGESLDSWLEAYASRTGIAWGDLLIALGLDEDTSSRRAGCRRPVLSLTSAQVASVAHATDLAPTVVRSLTLASLVGLANEQGVISRALLSRASRFCPRCLDSSGGRWQLWWRLGWAFACGVHHCLLADSCPHCFRRQRVERLPRPYVPELGSCTGRALDGGGPYARRCAATLLATEVVDLGADHPALEVQRELLTALSAGSISHGIYAGTPVLPAQFAADVTALGQRILRYASPSQLRAQIPDDLWQAYQRDLMPNSERSRSSPPTITRDASSVTVAVAASVAMPILGSRRIASGGTRLRSLVSPMRRRGLSVSDSTIGWGQDVSEALIAVQLSSLTPYLGPLDQLRYRCWSLRPCRPHTRRPVHSSVPALLWPAWAISVSAPGVGFVPLRSALSAALVMVGSRIDVRLACALLGSATRAPAVSRILQILRAQPDWVTTARMLTNLAEWLEMNLSPIDYERRRRLPVEHLLPEPSWRHICRDTASARGDSTTHSLRRCWLYERITGSPARCSPYAIDTRKFYSELADLAGSMTPELAAALDASGLEFLSRHGLGHEPLQWQPPSETFGASAPHRQPSIS